MKKKIRLLIVDDSEDDALLIIDRFQKSNYEVDFERVCSEKAMESSLRKKSWDAVTCDHSMPGFNAKRGLESLISTGLDIPFIIVSGYIDEVEAVELIKAGAHDYVAKGNHMTRLVTAVEREIREARNRKDKRRAETAVRFLAEASEILVASLNLGDTLEGIIRLIVPRFADACAIDLLNDEVATPAYFALSVDPEKTKIMNKMRKKYPLSKNMSSEFAEFLRTPRSKLFREVKEPDLLFYSRGPEHYQALLNMKTRSLIMVPLRVREKVIGVIAFMLSESDRLFDEKNLMLAEDLARRSAFAIDNSQLYQGARDAIKLRDEFLLIASHELRTPITTLMIRVQMMLRSFQPNQKRLTDERIISMLGGANRQIKRFSRLIEELLSVSRIETGKLQLEQENINLSKLVRETASQYTEELKSAGCALALDVDCELDGYWDSLRIGQVIGNLLSNAMKYGPGKPIEVVLGQKEKNAVLVVQDHGIGIAKKDQDRVFERFERAVSTHHFGGLGMGLYITRQIVAAHGGKIKVESSLGEGARFTVELPIVKGLEK